MRFFIIKQFRRKKVLKKTKNNIIMRQIEYKQSFKLHYPSKRDRHWMLWKNFSGSILAGGPFNRRYIKDIRWYFYWKIYRKSLRYNTVQSFNRRVRIASKVRPDRVFYVIIFIFLFLLIFYSFYYFIWICISTFFIILLFGHINLFAWKEGYSEWSNESKILFNIVGFFFITTVLFITFLWIIPKFFPTLNMFIVSVVPFLIKFFS